MELKTGTLEMNVFGSYIFNGGAVTFSENASLYLKLHIYSGGSLAAPVCIFQSVLKLHYTTELSVGPSQGPICRHLDEIYFILIYSHVSQGNKTQDSNMFVFNILELCERNQFVFIDDKNS